MMSSETPDSTEFYMKGSTPPELTPDASPTPSPTSKPRARTKNARFLRQSAVDDERGGASEIQVLVEGRSHGRPSPGSGLGEEHLRTANTNGHRHSSSNHKTSSRDHGSSNHKPLSREKWAEWTSQRAQTRLLEQDEEKLSNYEMEMKPLQPMDSNFQKPYGQGEERHRGKNRGKNRDREKEREREDSARLPVDSVQKLDSLRAGEKLEARPLRRDLMLSPPQKSSPIALEHDSEKHTQLKASSVSLRTHTHTHTHTQDTGIKFAVWWEGRTLTCLSDVSLVLKTFQKRCYTQLFTPKHAKKER
ncbi:Junctophilin-3 [Bagarius yarrelli]|uniref:Junctophilin-3 n=1 Tax=Bagarius yarrelli TaxID=175774 RepID=A0A556VHB1_BAGYA|nr:Junctophilin-3 [Bagarius yarrelli]